MIKSRNFHWILSGGDACASVKYQLQLPIAMLNNKHTITHLHDEHFTDFFFISRYSLFSLAENFNWINGVIRKWACFYSCVSIYRPKTSFASLYSHLIPSKMQTLRQISVKKTHQNYIKKDFYCICFKCTFLFPWNISLKT